MTVSVKAPTSTTGSIQLNGSDVLTIDSSGNLTAPNNLTVTGTVTQTGDANFSGDVGIYKTPNNIAQLEVKAGTSTIHQLFLEQNNTEHGWQFYADQSDGALAFFRRDNSGATERMRISTEGNVTIGTANSTSGGTKYTAGTSNSFWGNWVTSTATKNQWTFNNPNGEVGRITTNGSSTSFLTSSDYRLKENITPMSGSINRLKQLKPCTWTWKIDGSNGQGFVAHEVAEIISNAVSGTKDAVDKDGKPEYQGMDYSKLVPILTSALQEAITKIEDLETRIQALESA